MKTRVPSYYKKFKCIGSTCEDTCCAGWDVVIDDQTHEIYQKMKGPFGDRLRSKMVVDQEGDHIFVLDGVRCPFLNNHNLCDIHADIGEKYLCYTCKQYPRYEEEFGNLREMGISLSCPEAARIILGGSLETIFEVSDDGQRDDKVLDGDEAILEALFKSRDTILHILEMRDISLGLRMAIILRFVEELQDKLDFSEMNALKQVKEKYSDADFITKLAEMFSDHKKDKVAKYRDVHVYFQTYRDLVHMNTDDPLGFKRVLNEFWNSESDKDLYIKAHMAFNDYYKGKMEIFNKILVYFTYRYFMKSFYDNDMSSKIKVAIMSTIMIKELAVVRWKEKGGLTEADIVDISHEYSKDVEHLVENVEALERLFETEESYTVDKLLNTVLNEF